VHFGIDARAKMARNLYVSRYDADRPYPTRQTLVLMTMISWRTSSGATLRRSTFMQLERTHFRHTRPAEFWEMGANASEYALTVAYGGRCALR
jgi:hypothetical protein